MRGSDSGASAASSNASGRAPKITRSTPRTGRRAGSSDTRNCPKTTSSPSIAASTRFIAGEPMKAATKRSRGDS